MGKQKQTFAARLRVLREEAGFSAYGLAKKSGVSKQTVSNLESGRIRQPTLATAARLAKALGVSLAVFDDLAL